MTAVVIALAGGVGATLRVGVGIVLYRHHRERLAVGTIIVNVFGAFAEGAVIGSGGAGLGAEAGLGFLAGFTTFSTWMIEVVSAWGEGRRGRMRSVLHLASMLLIGLFAAAAGYLLAR